VRIVLRRKGKISGGMKVVGVERTGVNWLSVNGDGLGFASESTKLGACRTLARDLLSSSTIGESLKA